MVRVHGQAERLEAGERPRLARHRWRARRLGSPEQRLLGRRGLLQQLVGPEGEPTTGGHGRVELPQRARAAVARVGVERQPGLLALRVDPGELGLRHVDLATDLQRGRLGQARRDHGDRPQVGRDVLAGRAVAPGGAPDEPAVAVAEADGEAVDLQLGDVAQVGRRLGRGRQAQAAPDPGVEGPQLVLAEGVAQAEHRPVVAHLGEGARLVGTGGPHALGRRVGGPQARERGLEGDQLAELRVVLRVGDRRARPRGSRRGSRR